MADSDVHSDKNGECPESGGRGNKPEKQKKTLRELSEEQTMKGFSKCVTEEIFASRYCCGGTLENLPEVGPTTLRWDDTSEKGTTCKCNFPIDSKLTEGEVVSMVTLLRNACDENSALVAKDFSINVDPHGSGMLDIISQLPVPGFRSAKLRTRPEHRGIKATLTQLYVSQPLLSINHSRWRPCSFVVFLGLFSRGNFCPRNPPKICRQVRPWFACYVSSTFPWRCVSVSEIVLRHSNCCYAGSWRSRTRGILRCLSGATPMEVPGKRIMSNGLRLSEAAITEFFPSRRESKFYRCTHSPWRKEWAVF